MNILSRCETSLLALVLVSGCYNQQAFEDVEAIENALEDEDGGLDETDEAPSFAESDEGYTSTVPATDSMEDDPILIDLENTPGAATYRVAVDWGQLPGNPDNDQARNWSGSFSVNRGGLRVRRTIHWDHHDQLLPRTDRMIVPFSSHTLPHNDGLILTVIDPSPENDTPIELTYESDSGLAVSIELAELVDEPQELLSDVDDNRMVAAARREAVDVCGHGFLRGRWHRVADGRGVFRGAVIDDEGELEGHVRGVYGVRQDGSQVFFGKYINTEGEFRGIFRGTYGDGMFEGRWLHANEDRGQLRGRYEESIPGAETGGHFLGHWTETTCNVHR